MTGGPVVNTSPRGLYTAIAAAMGALPLGINTGGFGNQSNLMFGRPPRSPKYQHGKSGDKLIRLAKEHRLDGTRPCGIVSKAFRKMDIDKNLDRFKKKKMGVVNG